MSENGPRNYGGFWTRDSDALQKQIEGHPDYTWQRNALPKPRVWFWRPSWYWFGWQTLLPIYLGGDEFGRRTIVFGWTVTGRVIVAL